MLPCGIAGDLVFARARVLGVRKSLGVDVLGGELVLVDQSAEQNTPADPIKVDDVGHHLLARRMLAERGPLPECPVRAMLVVGR